MYNVTSGKVVSPKNPFGPKPVIWSCMMPSTLVLHVYVCVCATCAWTVHGGVSFLLLSQGVSSGAASWDLDFLLTKYLRLVK